MRIPLLGIVALLAALLVLDSGRSEAAEHPLPPVELTLSTPTTSTRSSPWRAAATAARPGWPRWWLT